MTKRIITTIGLFMLLFFSIKMNAQIPFEINKNGHIIIKAKINGVEGNFIFDTGAGLNVVFANFPTN